MAHFNRCLVAFCYTLFQLLLTGSKLATLVCTFFDYRSGGGTEMQLRLPEPDFLNNDMIWYICRKGFFLQELYTDITCPQTRLTEEVSVHSRGIINY